MFLDDILQEHMYYLINLTMNSLQSEPFKLMHKHLNIRKSNTKIAQFKREN